MSSARVLYVRHSGLLCRVHLRTFIDSVIVFIYCSVIVCTHVSYYVIVWFMCSLVCFVLFTCPRSAVPRLGAHDASEERARRQQQNHCGVLMLSFRRTYRAERFECTCTVHMRLDSVLCSSSKVLYSLPHAFSWHSSTTVPDKYCTVIRQLLTCRVSFVSHICCLNSHCIRQVLVLQYTVNGKNLF